MRMYTFANTREEQKNLMLHYPIDALTFFPTFSLICDSSYSHTYNTMQVKRKGPTKNEYKKAFMVAEMGPVPIFNCGSIRCPFLIHSLGFLTQSFLIIINPTLLLYHFAILFPSKWL